MVYTLNANYGTANRMATVKTQLANPGVHLPIWSNINTLTVIGDKLRGLPDAEETAEHTLEDYLPNGQRKDLVAYAAILSELRQGRHPAHGGRLFQHPEHRGRPWTRASWTAKPSPQPWINGWRTPNTLLNEAGLSGFGNWWNSAGKQRGADAAGAAHG